MPRKYRTGIDYLVYALIDPRNGELRYIGQSTLGILRAKQHAWVHPLKKNANPHKCNWIRSLLAEGLTYEVEVLERCESLEALNEAEEFYIQYFKFIGCRLLNVKRGGNNHVGWVPTPEQRRKISESQKGKVISEETRQKISLKLKGKPITYIPKPRTQEQKRKQAEVMGAKPFVDQHDTQYASLSEAVEKLGIAKPNLCNVLKGKRRSVDGYRFRYLDTPTFEEQDALEAQALDIQKEATHQRNLARSRAWRAAQKTAISNPAHT